MKHSLNNSFFKHFEWIKISYWFRVYRKSNFNDKQLVNKQEIITMKPKHYLLICISLIFSVISLVSSLHFFCESTKLDFKLADFYLKILIAIAGTIAGFSILALYTIVNANVDRMKQDIRGGLDKLEVTDKKAREIMENLETLDKKTIKAQKKGEDIDMNTLYLFVLTSEHTPDYYKTSAIQHFMISLERNRINDNMKETIRNYYMSLSDDKEKPVFFSYLEKLVALLPVQENENGK